MSMQRILVVDDDEPFRLMLEKTLTRAGYEVESVSNGRSAIEVQRQRPAALVITDIVMPEKEGIETIMELRRLDPQVRIIAMSGGGWSRSGLNLEVAKKLGARAALEKPFAQQKLLDAVAEALSDA